MTLREIVKGKINFIREFIKKIPTFFICIFYSIKTIIISLLPGKKIFILNTPIHGNLGDQAILAAEEKILNDTLKDYKIIRFSNSFCRYFSWLLKALVKESSVCLHGGGYLGDLWPREDKTVRKLLEKFRNNKIIFFPQTLCSENVDNYFEEVRPIFEANKNLVFFGRDKYTFDLLSKNLKNKVYYSPDIVLYEDSREYKKEDKITLCLRHDHEKTMEAKNEKELLSAAQKYNYVLSDTVITKTVFAHNRKKELDKIFQKIGTSKLLITDRLHGMIFAYLTKTPCLVFNSKSPKVLGVYKWLEKSDFIVLHDKEKNISDEIESILSKKFTFNKSVSKKDFDEMKNVLKEMVK